MFPPHKTKIVATVGPASEAPEVLDGMIAAGMNVARLNFSHGELSDHARVIAAVRAAAARQGRHVAVLADLPGPKLRIGELSEEPLFLRRGDTLTLTTEAVTGTRERIGVSFAPLPRVVSPGDAVFLNDGLIELRVESTAGNEVHCQVLAGGELRSRKGLNLPGIDLGISAFTPRDRECLEFALEQGVDAVSQSFVGSPQDVEAVRAAARERGHEPFVIAKIERANALDALDAILRAADGIMVARGDLGVEIPIAGIAVAQKRITGRAKALGRPVITATQMLMSMVRSPRPTRAEATDVANAILDGSDAVMLSEESATGDHPVAAVAMLGRIAAATEPELPNYQLKRSLAAAHEEPLRVVDLIALGVERTLKGVCPAAVLVPTRSGATARGIARFRLPVWVTAFCPDAASCRRLQFSYGVWPEQVEADLADWTSFSRRWLAERGYREGLAVLTQGPSAANPCGNHRMEIIDLGDGACPPT